MEITVEKGLGYVPREALVKGKADIGMLALDAIFSPIRRVNYEVENMRVGDRTDYNRLRIFIETDGTMEPREVLEQAVKIMIGQLRAIVGIEDIDDYSDVIDEISPQESIEEDQEEMSADRQELLKTRVESLNLSTRTENALINANIRTLGGLVSKSENELLDIEGLGNKALEEIAEALGKRSLSLKE
jgi:DNA-directed RNA polymerase subunit alpha